MSMVRWYFPRSGYCELCQEALARRIRDAVLQLTVYQICDALDATVQVLYFDGPDTEWDADTAVGIAQVLHDFGLCVSQWDVPRCEHVDD